VEGGGVEEFPITWEPGEEARFWFWDQSHWPHPTTPLAATLELPAMAEGFTRACRALARPFPAYHIKVVHGFVYFGFDLPPNADARGRAATAHAAVLAPRIADVARFWAEEALPEVQAANDRLRFTDWDAHDDAALAAALDELYALRARQWELHDLVLVPAMAALDRFQTLYARLLPDAPAAEAHALLRGLPNKATETARALWRLARDPAVGRWALAESAAPAAGSAADLPLALRTYLDAYGWRTDGWELSDPSLREEPAPLRARLRRYLADGHPDPERALARAAAEREHRTAAALARLPDAAARAAFLDALTAARAYPVLSEDHNFFIDQMGLTALRQPLLAMGRRLAARGVLARADDVFYLTRDELRAALHRPPAGHGVGALPADHLRALTDARRAERRRWWGARPPATIGAPLPADLADDPLYAGFFGVGAEPEATPALLRGVGAVPGSAAGPARVARTLAEAEDIAPGEILVCPMTSPAWTPILATAAGVVVDAGGVLSHTAIVAREFGIPCVVAARIASRVIVTGEWIEVDGTSGTVRRLDRSPRRG
jgi:phosphohistidine swiveling domain-containing protein